MIRVAILAVSAAFVLGPAVAYACSQYVGHTVQATVTDLAAKKKPRKARKVKTEEKVEYMRAVPTK